MAKVKISFDFQATASFVLEVDEAAVPSYTTVARAAEAYVKAAMSIGQGGSFPWAVDTTGMRMTPHSSYDVERVEEPDSILSAEEDAALRAAEIFPAPVQNPGPLINPRDPAMDPPGYVLRPGGPEPVEF